MRLSWAGLLAAIVLVGCGDRIGHSVLPAALSGSPSSRFTVPATLSRPVPPAPPFGVPAKPSGLQRSVRPSAVHPSFFAGEAALGNGVYYLALPNGNPFGYYSYLSDPNYIYHFDMGYEYVVDANDGQGGVYFYDFESSQWWYTSRTYAFPYLYDFGLSSVVYYYADSANAGHYTTNPRYFYVFATHQVVSSPFALASAVLPQAGGTLKAGPTLSNFTATIDVPPLTSGTGATLTAEVGSVLPVFGNATIPAPPNFTSVLICASFTASQTLTVNGGRWGISMNTGVNTDNGTYKWSLYDGATQSWREDAPYNLQGGVASVSTNQSWQTVNPNAPNAFCIYR